ncbi:YcgJ family protein [Synechococcus sp. CS-1329]|uniref:YcgJ family protein n=1 Tax=Synechococcus sp. CS-1329 TaxID=2847975 RepID=UPI00223B5549|nr:YcgJ family protein [Synechococcus sp. CS-1329]MCT0217994.1 YcgJ family protein [Synechococcus sp. CS-1329]
MKINPLLTSRPAHASLALAVGGLALLSTLAPQPGWTQSNSLKLIGNGVVCDPGSKTCYDRRGPSLAMTRQEFGQRAEQNLRRQISGRPNSWDLRFSSGEVCDLRQEICWDDGWKRSNLSTRLSRQLFGANGGWANNQQPGNNNWGNNAWGNGGWRNNTWGNNSSSSNNWRAPTSLDSGSCTLSQRGRRIFSGNCNLQRRSGSNGTAFVVNLANGRNYSFYDRRGQLVVVDGNRSWPVAYSRQGGGGEFRWGDLQLVARQNRAIEPAFNTNNNGLSGGLLQELINSLFR